jgi:FtsZ-binding cell division protein ZapB
MSEFLTPDEAIEICIRDGVNGISVGLAKELRAERDALRRENEALKQSAAGDLNTIRMLSEESRIFCEANTALKQEVEGLKAEKDYDGKEVLAAELAELRKQMVIWKALLERAEWYINNKNLGQHNQLLGDIRDALASPPSPATVESKPKDGA